MLVSSVPDHNYEEVEVAIVDRVHYGTMLVVPKLLRRYVGRWLILHALALPMLRN